MKVIYSFGLCCLEGGRGRVHVYIGSERKSENTDVTKIMKIEESHTWIINKSIKRVWLVPRRTQRWYRSWFVSVPFDCILSLIFPTSPPSLCALILCYGPQQCCHNNKDEIKCWSSSGAMKTVHSVCLPSQQWAKVPKATGEHLTWHQ